MTMKEIIKELKHYLPAQAPLKDFIHHNTLHAFQNMEFHKALQLSSEIFGAKMYLGLEEYRSLYAKGDITLAAMNRSIELVYGTGADKKEVIEKLTKGTFDCRIQARVGQLRKGWKEVYNLDMDSKVHPALFRFLCNFLDQGIALWGFPMVHMNFIDALRALERSSFVSIFNSGGRAHKLLLDTKTEIEDLLKIVVGNEAMYERYLFEQQMLHPGWSGLVSNIEDQPEALIDSRKITLQEVILFELLLEIDFLDQNKPDWKPLSSVYPVQLDPLFAEVKATELNAVMQTWHTAFEYSHYDQVMAALKSAPAPKVREKTDFQAIFCIDDRESSFRRYIEECHAGAETLSAPGFFGVEFFYQPENGKFYTKLCPAPMTPKYLIKQMDSREKIKTDLHFKQHTHSFIGGWFISQTLGFWSAFKLFISIFKPSMTPATASSLRHMDKVSRLVIENEHVHHHEHGLQVGFTIPEMTDRVYNLLRSIGLVDNFAPIVYLVGHGASSVNNPHYAAYDCGACSGRPGSVNARVFAYMANHHTVRSELSKRGLVIPRTTRFVGALHDTTRDEINFFDEEAIPLDMNPSHQLGQKVFNEALALNSKERSRRFESHNMSDSPASLLEQVRKRSVSLFEPRPELNHATNTLCIVGRRTLTQNVFLDRRVFLNSYDAAIDPEGEILTKILSAAVPVCGGINLEYFFSRVDNEKFGAGTKLPHNVMGLIGVANGIDGDLRPGLPSQMIEVHDPIRLLMIVEHSKDVALKAIQRIPAAFEWIQNDWMIYMSIDPADRATHVYKDGVMIPYAPPAMELPVIKDISKWVESSRDNLPMAILNNGGRS